jgi:GDP-4-dehydro-6-deoxy-D-mannose reductase
MRILVTGATGFVGRFVLRELEQAGHQLVLHGHEQGDIRDAALVDTLVREARPEACLHMAGIAFVPKGWTDPGLVFGVNVEGTIHVLESLRRHAPAARTLVVSSAQVYGGTPRERPVAEDDALTPDNLYGVSKVAADLMALLYARRYGMAVMTARPSNHIGPGQSADFVVPAFAAQLKAMAAGTRAHAMRVGNLESRREFADVRDVARAYRMLLEGGVAGRAYNIASGRFVKIGELLGLLSRAVGVQPAIEVDPNLYRPTDAQPALDTRRIEADTGWKPGFTLEQTLADVLADSR